MTFTLVANIVDNYQLSQINEDKYRRMETLLDRIKQIVKCEGITITAMERVVGASKGVLSRAIGNNTDIQSKWIVQIVENYPLYDSLWLLTGKGEMIRQEENEIVSSRDTKLSAVGEPETVYERPIEDPLYMTKFYHSLYTESSENYENLLEKYDTLSERYNELAKLTNQEFHANKSA